MTQGIDCHGVHVECCKAIVLFRPGIAIVGGSKHTATLTHLRLSSGKDVAIGRVNRERNNVSRCQAVISQCPTVSVISRTVKTIATTGSSGKNVSARIDRQ